MATSGPIANCANPTCKLLCYMSVMKLCQVENPEGLFPIEEWLCITCAGQLPGVTILFE